MKHQDDEQDVLYESGPIKAGTAVRGLNPGGIAREGILTGYMAGMAVVLWVDLAFTPARYHEGSFVDVWEIAEAADTQEMVAEMLAGLLSDAEVRAMAVTQWGEDVVAANEADVARRFNRPRRDEPFHPVHNTGEVSALG